jgi:hypothetical protein
MKLSLDLRGLPEPIAEAIVQLVEAIRQQLPAPDKANQTPVKFPVWEGKVIGPWKRSDLYEEHLDRKFPPRDQKSSPDQGLSEASQ